MEQTLDKLTDTTLYPALLPTTVDPGMVPGALCAWVLVCKGSAYHGKIVAGIIRSIDAQSKTAHVQFLRAVTLNSNSGGVCTELHHRVQLNRLVALSQAGRAAHKHYDVRIANLLKQIAWTCENPDHNTPQAVLAHTEQVSRLSFLRDELMQDAVGWLHYGDFDGEKDWAVASIRRRLAKEHTHNEDIHTKARRVSPSSWRTLGQLA